MIPLLYYLDKARTSAGYGDSYVKILNWAGELRDQTPNGIAMQLRFALFRENAAQDLRLSDPKNGKPIVLDGDRNIRKQRLIQVAELYRQYARHTRVPGEKGRDSTFDLSPQEEETAKKLIKELLEEWGDSEIAESTFIRALDIAESAPITFEENPDIFGISKAAKTIWWNGGNASMPSQISIHKTDWPLKNFRDVFKTILEYKAGSVELANLEQRLRTISEFTSEPEIIYAQIYLLKLIQAKKKHPHIIDQIKKELDGKETLPRFSQTFVSKRIASIRERD